MSIKKFGDVEVGDIILGTDGKPTQVVAAYDSHIPEKMYEIEDEDGNIIKASGNHLWYIETSNDYALHRQRRKIGKKILKNLTQKQIDELVKIAETQDSIIETSLIDMFTLLNGKDNTQLLGVLSRIAESLGPIAEENVVYQDYLTHEEIDDLSENIRHYDAVLFAQQILVLTGKKPFIKNWTLIIGQVITTENMVDIVGDMHIPVVKSIS